MSELSEGQKFSRENFRGLIKIRENRKSFLTVKLLSFTVYEASNTLDALVHLLQLGWHNMHRSNQQARCTQHCTFDLHAIL